MENAHAKDMNDGQDLAEASQKDQWMVAMQGLGLLSIGILSQALIPR
jgi:uncharacterized membrane protein YiaA